MAAVVVAISGSRTKVIFRSDVTSCGGLVAIGFLSATFVACRFDNNARGYSQGGPGQFFRHRASAPTLPPRGSRRQRTPVGGRGRSPVRPDTRTLAHHRV